MSAPAPADAPPPPSRRHLLPLLITGQVALHAAMAGQRMAAPLQALREGYSPVSVGVLLALFAALPVLTAMAAGRMADRHGYHRPLRLAVGSTCVGALLALAACWLQGWPQFALLCLGASASGMGANVGWIGTQRTAGQLSDDATERLRIFSWLGMAPSAANVIGPVLAGLMIDLGGHAAAYAALALLPWVSWLAGRRLPAEVSRPAARAQARRMPLRTLFTLPGLRRLLFVNWLLSASWDVHSFAVPVLGHAKHFPASTIGLVLGTFTALVTVVRFIVPWVAEHVDEVRALTGAMVCTGIVFALYPLASSPWLMAGCAALLGLTLGAVQPMIMSTLYQLTPAEMQGQAIAARSMAINVSSSLMPLAFGAAGAAFGPALLFWLMGGGVVAGSLVAPGLRGAVEAARSRAAQAEDGRPAPA